jgi:hypothetical protein
MVPLEWRGCWRSGGRAEPDRRAPRCLFCLASFSCGLGDHFLRRLAPQCLEQSLHARMLLVAEGFRIDCSEPAHDRERGDRRLGREPALNGGQMRIELRGHCASCTCASHAGGSREPRRCLRSLRAHVRRRAGLPGRHRLPQQAPAWRCDHRARPGIDGFRRGAPPDRDCDRDWALLTFTSAAGSGRSSYARGSVRASFYGTCWRSGWADRPPLAPRTAVEGHGIAPTGPP